MRKKPGLECLFLPPKTWMAVWVSCWMAGWLTGWMVCWMRKGMLQGFVEDDGDAGCKETDLLQMARCLNEGLAGRLSGWWLDGPPKAQLQVVDLDVVAEERDDVHDPLALDPSLDGKITG